MRNAPTIILVRPQMGENIGASARAMANFGGRELRLVAPRDGWPNPKASDTAGRALNIIDDAVVHADVASAVADCQFVLATSARTRVGKHRVLEVREAMAEMKTRMAAGEKCAVLFGPERTGLENEDMVLADAVVTIPVSTEYPSLNLGQAVVVVMHEWFSAVASHPSPVASDISGEGDYPVAAARPHPDVQPNALGGRLGTSDLSQGRGAPVAAEAAHVPASRGELSGLLDQLEAALDGVNFWRVPEKKDVMWRNIRISLVRAQMSVQEIATWRGLVKSLTK